MFCFVLAGYAQHFVNRQAALASQFQQQQRVAHGRLIQGQGSALTSLGQSKTAGGVTSGAGGMSSLDSNDLSMLLKQQVGAMPPIPNQREGVLTVEEIERRQQVLYLPLPSYPLITCQLMFFSFRQ